MKLISSILVLLLALPIHAADVKISALPTATSADTADLFPFVDVSATATKTITLGNLKLSIAAEPALGNPAGNGYVLSSTTGGTRSWIAASAYNPAAVAITGGTIAGTPISGSTGAFTFVGLNGLNTGIDQQFDSLRLWTNGVNPVVFRNASGVELTAGWSFGWISDNSGYNGTVDVRLSRLAANTLALRNGGAEQTLIVGPTSTGIRSNAGELEAFDNAGNVTVISPHAQDAPAWLYETGAGVDEMHRKANVFLARIEWYATTRRQVIDALDLAARTGTTEESVAAWAEFGARSASNRVKCSAVETFAEYETRTGKSLVPGDQEHDAWLAMTAAQRWAKVESDRAAKSVAARAAWQARHDAAQTAGQAVTETQPALYSAQGTPAVFQQ